MVFTNTTGNELWVVLGYSSSGLPAWINATAQLASAGQKPVHVASGDVNNDFRPDVALAYAGSNYLTMFLNTDGPTQFGSPYAYPLSAPARKVVIEDLNGDGNPELLAITADNKLQIFRHTGAGGAGSRSGRYDAPLTLATGVNPTTLQVAEINGDYAKDILVGCVGDNTVRVYLNRSLIQPTAAHSAQLTGLNAYPNPASAQLFVKSSRNVQGPLTATLLDNLGRTVREMQVQPNTTAIPVADLPRGVYTLRLRGKEGTSVSRIVLQ